jgi:hypothetical protein
MRALWGLQILDRDSMRFLAGLRGLHTLDLDATDPCGALEFLPSFPALSTLLLRSSPPPRCLPFVAQCANLTELSIHQPVVELNFLRSFMLSQLVQFNLLTLRFEDTAFAALNPSSFALMQGLRSLSFVHVESIDFFLSHLAHAASLRSLCIQPERIPTAMLLDSIRSYIPSPPVLLDLLTASPLLHCQLIFHTKLIGSSIWVQQNQYLRSLQVQGLREEQSRSSGGIAAPASSSLLVAPATSRLHIQFLGDKSHRGSW